MSVSREDQARIERAIDGQLSPDELKLLEADVVRDAGLRAEYVDRVWVEAALRSDRESLRNLIHAGAPPESRTFRWPLWIGGGVLAAACVVAGAVAGACAATTDAVKPKASMAAAKRGRWWGARVCMAA